MPTYSSLSDFENNRADFAEPVYMSTKAEIVEYYRDIGGDKWRSKFADDYSAATNRTRSTAIRAVQGKRAESVPTTAKARAEWQEFGKKLPPISYDTNDSYKITFEGYVKISENCDFRDFDEILSGTAAYDLINSPSFNRFMALYFPPGLVESPCGEYEITIEPL